MARKKSKKNTNKLVITSEQIFDAQKPQFNGFAGGYGAHGRRGYNRKAAKKSFRCLCAEY